MAKVGPFESTTDEVIEDSSDTEEVNLPDNSPNEVDTNTTPKATSGHDHHAASDTNGKVLERSPSVQDSETDRNLEVRVVGNTGEKRVQGVETKQEIEDRQWLSRIKSDFVRIAGEEKVIDREQFKAALQVKHVSISSTFNSYPKCP